MYFSYLAIMHYVNLVLTWPVRNSSAAMFHRPLKQPNPKKNKFFYLDHCISCILTTHSINEYDDDDDDTFNHC